MSTAPNIPAYPNYGVPNMILNRLPILIAVTALGSTAWGAYLYRVAHPTTVPPAPLHAIATTLGGQTPQQGSANPGAPGGNPLSFFTETLPVLLEWQDHVHGVKTVVRETDTSVLFEFRPHVPPSALASHLTDPKQAVHVELWVRPYTTASGVLTKYVMTQTGNRFLLVLPKWKFPGLTGEELFAWEAGADFSDPSAAFHHRLLGTIR